MYFVRYAHSVSTKDVEGIYARAVAYYVGSAKDTTSHINAYGILCINIKSGIIVQRAEKCADCGLLIGETRKRTKMYVTAVEV